MNATSRQDLTVSGQINYPAKVKARLQDTVPEVPLTEAVGSRRHAVTVE